MKNEMKIGDWMLIGLVLLVSMVIVIGYFPEKDLSEDSIVQIYQNGELLWELPLNTETTLDISGDYINHIEIQDGKVAVTKSDCPGNDCVKMGWLFEGHRSIVCLPNKIEIRLAGASEVDFVVQ